MPAGFFSLVLHAHLPFVRHPEHAEFLEEDWLYEAITEVYLPLLDALARLHDARFTPRLTINLSPTLCEMLADELLQNRYTRHLENLLELSSKELWRTMRDAPQLFHAAKSQHENLRRTHKLWSETYRHDILRAFRELQNAEVIEIITCAATHGFLPLISTHEARRAQIAVAVVNYEKHFARRPRGIWLPECAYTNGIENLLAEFKLEYFIADSHALIYGRPRPRYGIHAPVKLPNGVAVFARDIETGQQVWSATIGYPGDPFYREFYRDAGWDAPLEYLKPHLHADGQRRNLGFKYHRITDRLSSLENKKPYQPDIARERVVAHAEHFVSECIKQIARLENAFSSDNDADGFLHSAFNVRRSAFQSPRPPQIVAAYDAELFGHWWSEGVQFLEAVFRHLHNPGDAFETISLGDYLDLGFNLQRQQIAASSWGADGDNHVWLNEANAWMYPHQNAAEVLLTKISNTFVKQQNVSRLTIRALNQAARELLLAEASDWAFQIHHGTTVAYAQRRFGAHINRFNKLAANIVNDTIDETQLAEIERRDNIFAEIDYKQWSSVK